MSERLEALALHYHKTAEGEYGCPGLTCPGVQRLLTLLRDAEAPPPVPHRCSGCGHRWEGTAHGAELCGDCWRKAQPVLHAEAPPPVRGPVEPEVFDLLSDVVDKCYADGTSASWKLCLGCETESHRDMDVIHGQDCPVDAAERWLRKHYRQHAEAASPVRGAVDPPGWQPIETAPRNSSRILIYCPSDFPDAHAARTVFEAWWRLPYEGAPPDQCWWCYDGNSTMLSADVHRTLKGAPIGATHWMPLPDPPTASPVRAIAPRGPQETPAHPTIEFYEGRARWYHDGCEGLEDRDGYRSSGDLERDAASDILALCSRVRDLERALVAASGRAAHGVDCPKARHLGAGYLHGEDDDRPYDVDGVTYCGRCHGLLDRPTHQAPTT